MVVPLPGQVSDARTRSRVHLKNARYAFLLEAVKASTSSLDEPELTTKF
jgi:hypothetical protein